MMDDVPLAAPMTHKFYNHHLPDNTNILLQNIQLVQAQGLNFQPGVRVETNCQNCGFQQVRINGLDGPYTQLNEAVSKRLTELLSERNMTQYQLFMKSGVPKSTIGNVINCSYESVKLRIIHEMCQGLGITLCDCFQSPRFDDYHLDP